MNRYSQPPIDPYAHMFAPLAHMRENMMGQIQQLAGVQGLMNMPQQQQQQQTASLSELVRSLASADGTGMAFPPELLQSLLGQSFPDMMQGESFAPAQPQPMGIDPAKLQSVLSVLQRQQPQQ